MNGSQHNEDMLNYKSISCEQIPEVFLDKLVAKKHFSKFGKINRFILRPNRLCCTVEYETEEDAENAYTEAGRYNGCEFMVRYTEREVGHVQNTEEWVDPEVQAELDAMSSVNRATAPSLTLSSVLQTSALNFRPPSVMRAGELLEPSTILSHTKHFSQSMLPMKSVKPTGQLPLQKQAFSSGKAMAEPPIKAVSGIRSELEAMLRRPAFTVEDKYRVLDARDKLIRLSTVRQTDIKKAVSTKGTCPDMCPEKERLMREFQRQVSIFEMSSKSDNDDTTISHRRAIKEYSRSSADQEVPLPHELRTESVLQMTMLYLMHRIMDLCDDSQVSIADWFHFVWDRTRSIRKDITQQELCSLGAVELVEQCARFHIHCAARLVAEEPSVFDKKINAENLTKCLQTLKYMYHDLRIKQVHCPCEAEFRSYIVLLNLRDANFLWELKQLPEHIQRAPDIKRAISFYNALQNNNYVRFFDMMRAPETPYLSACILLGYFNTLRVRAMDAIIYSHNWRKHATFLPLPHLTKVLGFEDDQTTKDFLCYYGLQCDEERILLQRLKKPDLEYSMDRSFKLVESKRTVSVGSCIFGGPLPSSATFEEHQPHNSFNTSSILKLDAWTADDQLRGEAAVAKATESGTKEQTQKSTSDLQQQSRASLPIFQKDTNIFKIPQASTQILPKQQQRKLNSPNGFGDNQQPPATTFNSVATKASSLAPSSSRLSAYDSRNSLPNTDAVTFPDSNQNIFKIPAKNSTTSGTSIFKSIFSSNFEKPNMSVNRNIFADTNTELKTSTAAKPHPSNLNPDLAFEYPTSSAPESPTSIFARAAKETQIAAELRQEQQQQKHHAAEQRMRELEEEQQRKEQELEEERYKLKVLEEQRVTRLKAEKAKNKAEKLAQLQRLQEQLAIMSDQLNEKELSTFLVAEIAQIAHEELERRQNFEKNCHKLTAALITETLQAELESVAQEEYAVMCHDQLLLQRCFQRWLEHTRRRIQQRQLMENTPVWASTDTRTEHVEKLLEPNLAAENLKLIKRYRHGQPCDFQLLLWSNPHGGKLLTHQKLDIFEVLTKEWQQIEMDVTASCPCHYSSMPLPARKYFKLLLTLPGEQEELLGLESLSNKWLSKYVKKQRSAENSAYICALEKELALCVRKVSGRLPLNECGERVQTECDNSDGMICLMSSGQLQSTRERLEHLFKQCTIPKCVPLAFVVYNTDWQDEQQLVHCLQLQKFVAAGNVSAYKFFGLHQHRKNFDFVKLFSNALRFVARESTHCYHHNANEALQLQLTSSWLECCLGEEIWQRWHASTLDNPAFAKICSMPRHLVGLYNEAVERLMKMIAVNLKTAPEFPAELRHFVPPLKGNASCGLEYFPANWKCASRQKGIHKLLEKLKLPEAPPSPPPSAQDIKNANVEAWELWLLNYASLCFPLDNETTMQVGYETIQALILQLNRDDLQELPLHNRFSFINFLSIIKTLAFAHINHKLREQAQSATQLPKEVIYRQQDMLDYHQQPWWLNYKAVVAVTVDYTIPLSNGEEGSEQAVEAEAACSQKVATVMQKAEEICLKAEKSFLCLRREAINSSTCKLKRELDESFYQFDLAKRFSSYELKEESPGVAKDPFDIPDKIMARGKKRKRDNGNDNTAAAPTEADTIMAKAFALVDKIETQQDQQLRLLETNKLCFY